MKKILAGLGLLVAASWAVPASATVVTHTNQAAWNAAVGGATVVTDSFDNFIAQGQTITFDSGVMSTNSDPVSFDDNSVNFGTYNNAVSSTGSGASMSITWDFPMPIFAVSFNVISANSLGLQMTIDDGSGPQTFVANSVIGSSFGFLGFVGMGSFTQITFSANSGFDLFDLDNLAFAKTPMNAPEPGTLALIGFGLASLGVVRRRRKTA